MNSFDFFDKIYLITTPDASTKLEESLEELDKVGIKDKTEIVIAKDVSTLANKDYIVNNIFYNKYLVFKNADINNYENILILEDDISFQDDVSINLEKSLNDLPEDWDVLYLGGELNKNLYRETINGKITKSNYDPLIDSSISDKDYLSNWNHYELFKNNLIKSNHGLILLLYGVAFNNKFYKTIINSYENKKYDFIDIDTVLGNFQKDPSYNFYMTNPIVATVRPNISDRTHQWFDYDVLNNSIYKELRKMSIDISDD